MATLVIDYNRYKNELKKLYENIKVFVKGKKGFSPFLMLFISTEIYETLSKTENKLEFVISDAFIKDIETYYLFLFNESKKICLIDWECEEYLPKILSSLFFNFPPETLLWTNININNLNFTTILDTFISNGFNSPYTSTINPLFNEIEPSVCLTRQNIPTDPNSSTHTLKKVYYGLQQYKKKNNSCSIHMKFKKNCLTFLEECSKKGLNIKKDETQKEISGDIVITDIIKKANKFIYIIGVNKSSIRSGEEESVNVAPTRYNFHSHPKDAYIRHSVSLGWPSSTDYLGVLGLGLKTIFHCVSTLEGIYIISFSNHWASKPDKISKKFVEKNFEIDQNDTGYNVKEYLNHVNNITYKKYPIFIVQFLSWKEGGKVFKISFPKNENACLTTTEMFKKWNKLHSVEEKEEKEEKMKNEEN